MRHRSGLLALLCVAGLLTPWLSRAFADSGHTMAWLVDLATHWQWLYLGGLVVFGTLAAWRDRRWAALVLAAPLPWITAMASAPVTPTHDEVLNVASANVGLHSKDPDALATWLTTQQMDVVALSEVSAAYAQTLHALPGLPHRYFTSRQGLFGLALLSRHPLADTVEIEDADGVLRIQATVLLGQRPVSVTVVHPMPPIAPRYHRARNQQLRIAARDSEPARRAGVLLGDLNATPWSTGLAGPADEGFRRATGLSPTWPAILGGLFGIPIDQVLVTPHWSVTTSGTGPQIGSDHFPVWARLRLSADEPGAAGR